MSRPDARALERAALLFVEELFQRELAGVIEGVPWHTTKEQILLEAIERALSKKILAPHDVVGLWKADKVDKKRYSLLCQQALDLLVAQKEKQSAYPVAD